MERTAREKISFILNYREDFDREYLLEDALDLLPDEQMEKLFENYKDEYDEAWKDYEENKEYYDYCEGVQLESPESEYKPVNNTSVDIKNLVEDDVYKVKFTDGEEKVLIFCGIYSFVNKEACLTFKDLNDSQVEYETAASYIASIELVEHRED